MADRLHLHRFERMEESVEPVHDDRFRVSTAPHGVSTGSHGLGPTVYPFNLVTADQCAGGDDWPRDRCAARMSRGAGSHASCSDCQAV
jgi:hypothetical protein